MPMNSFLETLSHSDFAMIEPHLRMRRMAQNEVVACPSKRAEVVVLPMTAIVSVRTVMSDGREIETQTIGYESGFGLLHALGSPLSLGRASVMVGGDAYEIAIDRMAAAAQASASIVTQLATFAQASLAHSAQSTACNMLHHVEQRLCRCLLMTRDRVGAEVLPLTQEHLAAMLGVQRTTITSIAGTLQAQGLLTYSRGRIQILNFAGVTATACGCHQAIGGAAALLRPGSSAAA